MDDARGSDRGNDRRHRRGGSRTDERARLGMEMIPKGLTLNLEGLDRRKVGLGSYLIQTSGCIDCHNRPTYLPGGDPFKGEPEMQNVNDHLTGGRTFGEITADNLTPDANGLPAGLSRDDFIKTMQTGRNPKDTDGKILQVMPWPSYGKMAKSELKAIYEYLRAIPQRPDNPAPGP